MIVGPFQNGNGASWFYLFSKNFSISELLYEEVEFCLIIVSSSSNIFRTSCFVAFFRVHSFSKLRNQRVLAQFACAVKLGLIASCTLTLYRFNFSNLWCHIYVYTLVHRSHSDFNFSFVFWQVYSSQKKANSISKIRNLIDRKIIKYYYYPWGITPFRNCEKKFGDILPL